MTKPSQFTQAAPTANDGFPYVNEFATTPGERICTFTQLEAALAVANMSDQALFARVAGDIYTGAHDFGGASDFEIPNGTAPTVDTAGQIALDTNGVTPVSGHGVLTGHDGTQQVYWWPTTGAPASDNDVMAYDSATNSVTWQAQIGGGISNVVEDTTPQLGGALDGQGNDLNNMGVLFLTEQAAAEADVAGKGQVWVKTATPNQLWFTDDAGTDYQLASLAGTETFTGKTIDGDNNTLSNLDIGNEVDWAVITDVADRTAFAPGDKVLIFEAGVGMRKVDYDDLPGAGGGLSNVVEDTTPQLGGMLDVNGNAIGDGTRELITFTEDVAAVNHVNIENEATGGGPIISAAGDDTNIDLLLAGKGSGVPKIGANAILDAGDIGSSVQAYDADLDTWATITPGANVGTFLATPSSANLAAAVTDETGSGALVFGTSPTIATPTIAQINDTNGNESLLFSATASAVNEITLANAATGNAPVFSATGGDTNIGITFTPKGTGNFTAGNFVFDADQTVGAGQDNYVLTYDNATGLISLEASAGGGGLSNAQDGAGVELEVGIVDTALTNTVSTALEIFHTTSGTPAAGIGVGIDFIVETSAGNNEIGGQLEFVTTDVTATSEDFDAVFNLMIAGAAASEVARITGTPAFGATSAIEMGGTASNAFLAAANDMGIVAGNSVFEFENTNGVFHAGQVAVGRGIFGNIGAGNRGKAYWCSDTDDIMELRRGENDQKFMLTPQYASTTDYQRGGLATSTVTLATTSGASATTSGLVPAKTRLKGISARIDTAVTGPTSLQFGDGTDVDRFGTGIALALGTVVQMSDATADPGGWTASALEVTVTAVGGNFTAGSITIVAYYETTEAD